MKKIIKLAQLETVEKPETAEELLEMVKKNNMEFSEEEVIRYFEATKKSAEGELGDDELDNVAGGACSGSSETSSAICSHYERKYSGGEDGDCETCRFMRMQNGFYVCTWGTGY